MCLYLKAAYLEVVHQAKVAFLYFAGRKIIAEFTSNRC